MARLVLLGGGHSHIEVLRRAPAMAMPAELVLVEPNPALPYTGMVPGFIAGIYRHSDILIDLIALCARAGAVLKRAHAIGVDTTSRQVLCDDGTTVAYDVLSIDIGSTLDMSVPGVAEHALLVRPLWRFVAEWPGAAQRSKSIVVAGAGAAGIELALAFQAAVKNNGGAPSVTVVGDGRVIAPGLTQRARLRLHRICAERGIQMRLGTRVVRVTSEAALLENGMALPAHTVVWATGPAPHAWLRESGLALDDRGYLAIDRHLRVGTRPDVYAAGDVAGSVAHPRPKAGVYAVREAPVLADNLRRALLGQEPRVYFPQGRALALIGTADCSAVAAYGPLSAEGAWVWRWKDAIDRRFVQRYRL